MTDTNVLAVSFPVARDSARRPRVKEGKHEVLVFPIKLIEKLDELEEARMLDEIAAIWRRIRNTNVEPVDNDRNTTGVG